MYSENEQLKKYSAAETIKVESLISMRLRSWEPVPLLRYIINLAPNHENEGNSKVFYNWGFSEWQRERFLMGLQSTRQYDFTV